LLPTDVDVLPVFPRFLHYLLSPRIVSL
jgi:hypothetical protein